jgi:hypothetical protein
MMLGDDDYLAADSSTDAAAMSLARIRQLSRTKSATRSASRTTSRRALTATALP